MYLYFFGVYKWKFTCPFDDVMFSWFFMIPIALCKCYKCLQIWRSHHCFQTWSTDSSKESSSPPGGRTMKCTVALGLVKQDHMVAPSLGWHDVSLVQALKSPINNCMVLGKYYGAWSGCKAYTSPVQWLGAMAGSIVANAGVLYMFG